MVIPSIIFSEIGCCRRKRERARFAFVERAIHQIFPAIIMN